MGDPIHIIPHIDGGWIIKKEGAKEGSRFSTREEALRVGRTMCDTLKSELIVHNRDGTVTRQ